MSTATVADDEQRASTPEASRSSSRLQHAAFVLRRSNTVPVAKTEIGASPARGSVGGELLRSKRFPFNEATRQASAARSVARRHSAHLGNLHGASSHNLHLRPWQPKNAPAGGCCASSYYETRTSMLKRNLICPKCHVHGPWSLFGLRRCRMRDGRICVYAQSWCRRCRARPD
jgi:hypothetical protein